MLGPPLPPNPGLPGFGTIVRKSDKPDLRSQLLNYVIAIYLIVVGLIGLNDIYHFIT
jgi:hypothetical protein